MKLLYTEKYLDKVMKITRKLNFLLISILLLHSTILLESTSLPTEEQRVIQTRITKMSWPFSSELRELKSGVYTEFKCDVEYEIINNYSRISIYVGSFPYFIPRINASFEDSSLEAGISYIFLPMGGNVYIESGIEKKSAGITFTISNHNNHTIPSGNYTFWYGVTHEDVITLSPFYTTINASKDYVIINHQGTNQTLTYPEEETSETNFGFFYVIFAILVCHIITKLKRKKIQLENLRK